VLVGYGNIYSAFDASRPFVFFPLQVEPEISTMLYAPYYTDQLWMAKQIAKSLPIDCVLYVKEHPAMYGKRPFNFYKDLTSIPNVRLVRPNISSFELTTRAALLIVITSTVGWEGHLLKKPVIVFGDVFYNKLPGVVKCSAISDLPNLVHHQLTKYGYNEEALVNYLTAQFKESVEIDLTTIWDGEGGKKIYEHAAELNSLVDLLTRTVGLA
jgi:CDP-glycerol glycerophosphotransferase (TagB/SpsB family)